MKNKQDDKQSIISSIPRAWGIQILLLFLMVAPQSFWGIARQSSDVSPIALVLVCLSGYAGWLVWTKNGKYRLTSFESIFYIESKGEDCGMLHRSCWHFSMGLMLLLVFITLQGLM